jgi:hypothetical protein
VWWEMGCVRELKGLLGFLCPLCELECISTIVVGVVYVRACRGLGVCTSGTVG